MWTIYTILPERVN